MTLPKITASMIRAGANPESFRRGDELSARLLETQATQALVRCAALNKMTRLGMGIDLEPCGRSKKIRPEWADNPVWKM